MRKDPQLQGPFKMSLMTTIPRRVGDHIAGYFGTYRSRAPSKKTKLLKGLPDRLDTIHLKNVPGSSVFACFYCQTVAINSFWFALQGRSGGNTSLRMNVARPALPTIRRGPKTPSTLSPTAPSWKILELASTMKTELVCSARVTFPKQAWRSRLLSG